ncbi:MAG: hypothetical protein V1820_06855 [archaeon]
MALINSSEDALFPNAWKVLKSVGGRHSSGEIGASLDSEKRFVLAVQDGEEIVSAGVYGVVEVEGTGKSYAYVERIATTEDSRKKGAAQRMLKDLDAAFAPMLVPDGSEYTGSFLFVKANRLFGGKELKGLLEAYAKMGYSLPFADKTPVEIASGGDKYLFLIRDAKGGARNLPQSAGELGALLGAFGKEFVGERDNLEAGEAAYALSSGGKGELEYRSPLDYAGN